MKKLPLIFLCAVTLHADDRLPVVMPILYPTAMAGIDYTLRNDSNGKGVYIDTWNLKVARPDEATIADAWKQFLSGMEIARKVKAAFEQLPADVQTVFSVSRLAVEKCFAMSDVAGAKAVIESTPVTDSCVKTKADLLALFP